MKKSRLAFRRQNANSQFARFHLRESEIQEIGFRKKVDEWVLQRWSLGANSFCDLLSDLPGIYPSEVLCALRRLRAAGEISEFDVLAVELEAASRPALHHEPVEPDRRLIEHPLDFEWRFTWRGAARICNEIDKSDLKPNSKVLCLGCPSVYLFGRQYRKHIRFSLWDKNTALLGQMDEARDIRCLDVAEAMPPLHAADLAVIDPPWYNEFYKLFIWAAFNCLPLGGRILLSFPPEGTRASAIEDLNSVIKWCSLHGLKLKKRQPNYLPYRSPLFEVNALREQGVTNFPLNWRRGDLIVLTKQQMAYFSKPSCSFPKEEWEEIRVGASRIKICADKKHDGALFGGVGPTEVLPSVSSRYKLRRFANVVTSGNRFLRSKAPDDLLACFAAVDPSIPDSMSKGFFESKHPLLMRKVTDLIFKEEREAAHYFRRIHEL
jgi:hypothetical protein